MSVCYAVMTVTTWDKLEIVASASCIIFSRLFLIYPSFLYLKHNNNIMKPLLCLKQKPRDSTNQPFLVWWNDCTFFFLRIHFLYICQHHTSSMRIPILDVAVLSHLTFPAIQTLKTGRSFLASLNLMPLTSKAPSFKSQNMVTGAEALTANLSLNSRDKTIKPSNGLFSPRDIKIWGTCSLCTR